METTNLTEALYGEWDEFCKESSEAWFWHTSTWLEYTRLYKPEFNSESLSFLVTESGATLAICPLFLEKRGARKEFSFGGGGLPTPALLDTLRGKKREKILRFIFGFLDATAKEKGVSRTEFRFPVLGSAVPAEKRHEWNYLTKFGYLDTSIGTQLILTERSVDALKREVRHGHESDIDRATKMLRCEIFESETITPVVFNAYREMHKVAAGRATRPLRTFEIQYELLKRGNAFLAAAKKNGEFVGFSYVVIYKQSAYYASACNDPRFAELPIAHFLQWKGIEHMQTLGITHYEIGWQRFMPSLSGIWSDKEISISKFMRGFGGITVPLFRGEKYYDPAYFLEVYEERLRKSKEAIEKAPNAPSDEKTT